jgi:TonB family protein
VNDRTGKIIAVSLILHAALLLIIPAPTFDPPDEQEPETLRVSFLQEQPRETGEDEPEREPSETTVRTGSSKSPSDQSPEPEQAEPEDVNVDETLSSDQNKEQPSEAESPPQKEPAASSQKSQESSDETDPKPSPESPTTSEGVTEKEPEDQSAKNSQQDKSENNPLESSGFFDKREQTFRSRSTESSPPQDSTRSRSVIADNQEQKKVRVNRTQEITESAPDTVTINTPTDTSQLNDTDSVPAYTIARRPPEPVQTDENDGQSYHQPNLPGGGRKILSQPLPTVPEWLEETGEEVQVVVRYSINSTGDVISISLIRSSAYPELDRRVMAKIEQWKFEAGKESQQKMVAFRFVLN